MSAHVSVAEETYPLTFFEEVSVNVAIDRLNLVIPGMDKL